MSHRRHILGAKRAGIPYEAFDRDPKTSTTRNPMKKLTVAHIGVALKRRLMRSQPIVRLYAVCVGGKFKLQDSMSEKSHFVSQELL